MDVFVESNFVLELAFQQKDFDACNRILAGATANNHTLHVPQYALTEVFHTLHHKRSERAQNQEYFRKEIEQHRREAEADEANMDHLARLINDLLTARTQAQTARLFTITAQLAARAPGPALTANVLLEAQFICQQHGLSSQDSLVYASVLAGLRLLPPDTDKLFITRNKKDFDKPSMVEELQNLNCRLFFNFSPAADLLEFLATASPNTSTPGNSTLD